MILCGVLQHPKLEAPTVMQEHLYGTALSFGKDWTVEASLTEPCAPSRHYRDRMRPGDLLLGEGGPLLTFVARPDDYDHVTFFSLNDGARADSPSEAAWGFGWRIRATEEDRRLPHARPVFEWLHQATADVAGMIA